MKKLLLNSVKSAFSSAGMFLARKFPDQVNGHKLEDDLKQLIQQKNPVCFDIGANRGQTIQLFQHCLKRPVIYAFEPATETFATLASQSFVSSVYLHQLAMGSQAGVAEFRNYSQSELSSFLAVNPNKSENLFAEEELVSIESVPVETLDNFCISHEIDRIDLLKIDTQGFELPVLRGATDLFQRKQINAVLLELNFAALYEGQSDPLEIMQLLRSQQMRLVDFYEKSAQQDGNSPGHQLFSFVIPEQQTQV